MSRGRLRLVGAGEADRFPGRKPEGRCLWCGGTVYSDQAFLRVSADVIHDHCGPYQPRFGQPSTTGPERETLSAPTSSPG